MLYIIKIGGIKSAFLFILMCYAVKRLCQQDRNHLTCWKIPPYTLMTLAGCGLQVAGCELRVTGYGLRVTGYGLRVTGCELRFLDFGFGIVGVLGFRRVELDFSELNSDMRNPVFHYSSIPSFQLMLFRGLHSFKYYH